MPGCHQPELTTYLGWLVGDQHTLPPSDGVFYILGMAVPFHSDQVAGRCNLPCNGKEGKKQETLFSEARPYTGWQDLPSREMHVALKVYQSTDRCLSALKASLPKIHVARHQKQQRLSQAHSGHLWLNLNQSFPRSHTEPKCELSGSSAALPADNSCWIFTPAESLYFPSL